MYKSISIALGLILIGSISAKAQLISQSDKAQQIQLNAITTAVPFLQIGPDSRSGAMGDAGVAISPDANSVHWNASKLAFAKNEMEFSLSYAPWLRALTNDMSIGYLSGYKKLNKTQAIGGSLRYFTLGQISFTDETGAPIRDFKPAEYAIDMVFAQKLSEKFSGGIAARFVNSNLTGGTSVLGADSKPGRSFAVDVNGFYTNDDIKIADIPAIFNFGFNISNIGAKMRYTNTDQRDFIPTNLRIGSLLALQIDEYNQLGWTLDLNKLLVPTPPIYDNDGNIISGKDPNVGTATGIVQSFSDAPGQLNPETGEVIKGSILKEELREINIGTGIEYWYDQQFAFRTGYFYEDITKGSRQYITLGAGLKYQVLMVDVSYLISTSRTNNPLAGTLRFSLKFTMGKDTKRSTDETAD
ncbi:MAG: type IX secretion system outer membrane channel protein PorV [Flavobacteriales bacterium]